MTRRSDSRSTSQDRQAAQAIAFALPCGGCSVGKSHIENCLRALGRSLGRSRSAESAHRSFTKSVFLADPFVSVIVSWEERKKSRTPGIRSLHRLRGCKDEAKFGWEVVEGRHKLNDRDVTMYAGPNRVHPTTIVMGGRPRSPAVVDLLEWRYINR